MLATWGRWSSASAHRWLGPSRDFGIPVCLKPGWGLQKPSTLGVLPGTERGHAWQEPARLKLPGHWNPRAVVVTMKKQYKKQLGGGRGTTGGIPQSGDFSP